MLKAKFKAMLIHSAFTILTALIVSALVFWLWYPGIFSQIMPGTKLFLLILLVEIVLGPCMSLVVFNPHKAPRELILDYGVIIVIQLVALIYGLVMVSASRPVYVVFVKDRFEVVAAAEIGEKDLLEASSADFMDLPWRGPRFICARHSLDVTERERLLFTEIPEGKDVQHLPRYYKHCNPSEVFNHAYPLNDLQEIVRTKGEEKIVAHLPSGRDIRWVPINGKLGAWVAILDSSKNIPVEYLEINPYE